MKNPSISKMQIGYRIFYAIILILISGVITCLPSILLFSCSDYQSTFEVNPTTWGCSSEDSHVFCGEYDWVPWCQAEKQSDCFVYIPNAPTHFFMFHPFSYSIQLDLNQSMLPSPRPVFTQVQFGNPNLKFNSKDCLKNWQMHQSNYSCQKITITVIGVKNPVNFYNPITIPSTSEFWVNFSLGDGWFIDAGIILFDNITLSGEVCPEFSLLWIFSVWILISTIFCGIFFCKYPRPEKLKFSQKLLAISRKICPTLNPPVELVEDSESFVSEELDS